MKSISYPSSLPPIAESRNEVQRNRLPIRSIVYKKRVEEIKDVRTIRPNRVSLPGVSLSSASFVQAKVNDSFLEKSPGAMTDRVMLKSNLACDYQRLRNNKPLRSEPDRESTSANSSIVKSRIIQSRIPASASAVHVSQSADLHSKHHDYFQLLFDKSRKGFKVQEFEGTDPYYTNEMVMSRIYDQGFRHPDYYAKANRFKEMRAPDEKAIKSNYMLKIVPNVESLENSKTEVTYLLGGGANNANFIENVVNSVKETRERFEHEKDVLKREMDNMMKGWTKELESITKVYGEKMKGVDDIIKNNAVKLQTEKFKMQKEIVLLQRDKLKLEKEIEEAIVEINGFEDKMYGQNIFDLAVVDKLLDAISDRNLRVGHRETMKNSRLLH